MIDSKGRFQKSNIPWNKGKRGLQIAWNKDRKWSKEIIEKMKFGHIKNPTKYWQGKKRPDISLLMSKIHKGLHRSPETEFKTREPKSEFNSKSLGYITLHQWIKRHKPKSDVCENCKTNKPYDLANISQQYKRDINDFEWLCRSCHMNKDGRLSNHYKREDGAII